MSHLFRTNTSATLLSFFFNFFSLSFVSKFNSTKFYLSLEPNQAIFLSMSSQTGIDDLPPEMICELFKHISLLRDLVACSMVNKRWYSIYSAFKLERLAVFSHCNHYLVKWCYSDRKIEDKELYHPDLMSCRFEDKSLFTNLKFLALGGECSLFEPHKFDLNKLNLFEHLVHLEVNIGFLDEEKVNLKLSNLKVAAFHRWNYYCPLFIDCPKLNILLYRGESFPCLLAVNHPETIRKLNTNLIGTKLTLFKNVESLITQEFKAISMDTVKALPKLKQLFYDENLKFAFEFKFQTDPRPIDRINRIKLKLKEFVKDVKAFKGDCDFQFSFTGFRLNKTNIDEIDFGLTGKRGEVVSNEYIYMTNYLLIDPECSLDFIDSINYSGLMKIGPKIPSCFFRKFANINLVIAGGQIKSESHFLTFLKSLKSLRKLKLICSKLSQKAYDQLPASAPSLIKFDLEIDVYSSNDYGPQLNFDFISKFLHLSWLYIRPYLSFESFTSLVNGGLGKLKAGDFLVKLKEKTFFFIRKEKGLKAWNVKGPVGKQVLKTENPNQIIDLFEEFQRITVDSNE